MTGLATQQVSAETADSAAGRGAAEAEDAAGRGAAEAEDAAVAAWHALLSRHAVVWCALERELGERHALGVSEFEVLERLADDDRPELRVQDLAAEVYLSQSALSRVIGRLERDGLVARSICEADRRGIFVSLTSTGRERYAAARATQRNVLAATLSR